jgi:hypothetical protein
MQYHNPIPTTESSNKKTLTPSNSPKWAPILSLRPFKDAHPWRSACLEGVGLCCWDLIAGLVAPGTADLSPATSLGPALPVGIAAIVQFLIITLFTFSLGPVRAARI